MYTVVVWNNFDRQVSQSKACSTSVMLLLVSYLWHRQDGSLL